MRLFKTLTAVGFCAFVAGATLTSPVSTAYAQQNTLRIAAVVNDDLVSVYDLKERIELTMLSANLKDSNQTRQRLAGQTLRQLIDEKIKLQAAKENNVSVRDAEINGQIAKIESNNKMPSGQLLRILQARHVDPETLRSQIRAQIAWAKLVGRKLRRRVNIGEDQIDEVLNQAKKDADKQQKRVFEIFVPLESQEREVEVRQNVDRMVNQLREGANFSGMARTFSHASSAGVGGDRGWVLPGDLPPDLQEVVKKLGPGQISAPIETLTGFYILKVTDTRRLGGDKEKSELTFSQISLPLVSNNSNGRQAVIARAQELRKAIKGCADVEAQAKSVEGASVVADSKAKLGDLSGPVRTQVENLKKGETSQPISLDKAVLLITLCDRTDGESNLPSRREIRQRLTMQRMELLERQYIRDLRQAAFIDVRL